jgi:hypothetical protein
VLSSSRIGHFSRRPRLYQFCSALVTNERALVRDQAKPYVEAQPQVLTRKANKYPVATQAPVLSVHPVIIGGFVRKRDMSGHSAILGIQPSAFVSLYLLVYIDRRKAEQLPPGAATLLKNSPLFIRNPNYETTTPRCFA